MKSRSYSHKSNFLIMLSYDAFVQHCWYIKSLLSSIRAITVATKCYFRPMLTLDVIINFIFVLETKVEIS